MVRRLNKTKRQNKEYQRSQNKLDYWENHFRQIAMKQIRYKQECQTESKAQSRKITITEELRGVWEKINRVRKNLHYPVITDTKKLIS